MKRIGQIILLTTVTTAILIGAGLPSAWACSADGKEGFLPKNKMRIPVRREIRDIRGNLKGGGISEAEFNGVISAVERMYAPIAEAMGGKLVTHRDWQDPEVNAKADREDGNWNMTFTGGFARHRETTIDAFLLVVCHELGHHIGGAPKWYGDDWAANEGQSDYWAALKCARRVLQKEKNLRALPDLNAPDSVRVACRKSFAADNEAALCIRTTMAGLSLARILKEVTAESGAMPDFSRPDPERVTRTFDDHPASQCRLDTYFAGSVCPVDFRKDTDAKDPTLGTCAQERGATVGARPRCWYAPGAANIARRVTAPRARAGGTYY